MAETDLKKGFNTDLVYKNTGGESLKKYQLITRSQRILPSFFILGAQKSGTTSICNSLKTHPQITSPTYKEIFFFNGNPM